MLEGRSSVGRLGLFVHITAGLEMWVFAVLDLEMFAVNRCASIRASHLPIFAAVKGKSRSTTAISIRTTRISAQPAL